MLPFHPSAPSFLPPRRWDTPSPAPRYLPLGNCGDSSVGEKLLDSTAPLLKKHLQPQTPPNDSPSLGVGASHRVPALLSRICLAGNLLE